MQILERFRMLILSSLLLFCAVGCYGSDEAISQTATPLEAESTVGVTTEEITGDVTTEAESTVGFTTLNPVVKTTNSHESTYIPKTTVPRTTDVCGLSLIAQSEKDAARSRQCKCSDFDEEVDCSYLEVTTLPKLISFPKSARHVNFRFNKIQNIGQDTFYNGRSVIELDLSHNSINFISSVAFRAFKILRRLDLSHNNIWNLPSKSFDGLTSLRILDVGYNNLVNIGSDLFAEVPNVTELHLESNPLLELEPKVFQHLRYLEILNLGSTMLKLIPDHLFVFTPQLKLLDLSNNLLTYVPADALKVLHPLKFLDLSGNHMTTIKEESFLGMRGLVALHLDRMPQLRDIEKYAFGDLQMLQELHCNYNFLLSDIDEKAFVKKSDSKKVQLPQLLLRQNAIQTLPKELLDWNENTELQISDNPLFCDCHMQWMVHLKLKNDFQKYTKCQSPSHLQGITLDKLKDTQLGCGMHLYEIVMIVLSSIIFLLVLGLIIAFLIWRRKFSGYNRPYFRVPKKKNINFEDKMDEGI